MASTDQKPLVCMLEELTDYVVFSNDELRTYQNTFEIITFEELTGNSKLAQKVQGLITSSLPSAVSKALAWIPRMPNLKAIASIAAGYDYIYDKLKPFGIPFANCPDVHTESVADHAMALVLASGCGLMPGIRATTLAEVPRRMLADFRNPGVFGSTLGIIGMGNIGSAIAKRAQAFQMSICYHNRSRTKTERELALGATFYSCLDEMLPRCDYVVVSCSLSDETRGMFGKKQFMGMKKSAVFVNVSRGKVVDTDALVEALTTGEIAHAALDVTEPEPLPPGHALLGLDNVILTPHVAPMTLPGMRKCLETVMTNLKAALVDNMTMPNEIKC